MITWHNLKGEYQILIPEAVALKNDLRKISPSLRLMFHRKPLDVLEARVDTLSMSFSNADSRLTNIGDVTHGVADWASHAAGAQLVSYIRDSVRTLIHECYSDIHDLRNRLNTQAALLVSLVAVVIAAASVIVDVSR